MLASICALICKNPSAQLDLRESGARFDLRFYLRKSQRKFSRKSGPFSVRHIIMDYMGCNSSDLHNPSDNANM